MAAELAQLRSQRTDLDADRTKILGEISQSQIEINGVATKLASLERDLEDLPPKVAALEETLRQEIAKRTQTARLPVQRDTDKREMPYLFRAGRLHSVYLVNPNGSVVDSGECETHDLSGGEAVEPKAGTGVPVEDTEAARSALITRLRQLDSQTDYVAVFLWSDSFARFGILKDILVENSFEYRLVPMAPDGKVIRNAGRTSAPKVQ